MKKCLSFVLFVILSANLQAQDWFIQSARILDFQRGEFTEPLDLLVTDGKIRRMGGGVEKPETANVIDANGAFIVPGFTEMHAHVPSAALADSELHRVLFLYAAHGITTIRGMLGHPLHLKLRNALAQNALLGPRLVTSGPSFNGRSVNGVTQAKQMVKDQVAAGYDFLKIHPGMSAEEMAAVAWQAEASGIPFAGHVTAETGIIDSVAKRQASIDHLDGVIQELARRSGVTDFKRSGFFGLYLADKIDSKHIEPLARELAKSGVAMVPTDSLMEGFLSPQTPEESALASAVSLMHSETVDRWKRARRNQQGDPRYSVEKVTQLLSVRQSFLKAFSEAGGLILSGSDAPQVFNVPGDSLHTEMAMMQDAGLSPIEILKSTSLSPARYFGDESSYGEISEGKDADFVLLTKNPLKNIENTRTIKGVMLRGQWLSQEKIAAGKKRLKSNLTVSLSGKVY